MSRRAWAFAVVVLPWLASTAGANCNRPEYGPLPVFEAPCEALGIPIAQVSQTCTSDRLVLGKADVDWVLFGNVAALEAYRASVKEQLGCGFPLIPITRDRALWIAVKSRDPLAECMVMACEWQIDRYIEDLEAQGKLPKE
jgi:hypothetical protein